MTSFEIVNKIFNISSIFISNAVIEKNILGAGEVIQTTKLWPCLYYEY